MPASESRWPAQAKLLAVVVAEARTAGNAVIGAVAEAVVAFFLCRSGRAIIACAAYLRQFFICQCTHVGLPLLKYAIRTLGVWWQLQHATSGDFELTA